MTPLPITPDRARRDLRWILEHPPIVRDHTHDGARWIGQACIGVLRDGYAGAVDAIPDALLGPALEQRRSGRYFEALLVALIQSDHRLELLAHDLQVQDAQRTIGAFDLLVRTEASAPVTHLELAFKQYLYRGGDPTDPKYWVGPRGRDRLDLKTLHMHSHQLRLGASEPGRKALESMGIGAVAPHALMAGRLFIHRDDFKAKQRPALPQNCSDAPQLGWWCAENDIDGLIATDASWRALPPNYAVAPLNAEDCGVLPIPDWQAVQQRVADGHPCLVAEIHGGAESNRGWIVANSVT